MSKSTIQNSIRKLRFNADEMTQQQLADKVGASRQTIVAIEKGNYSPSLELAFRIAHVFNTPLEEVFTYDENKPLDKKQITCN
ncbi:MAG: helix-turn-helix transcriptional regulator [Salinivirgaceae bacterium]|jgi:putative transcriptional regulator|nr:helix-turn-helix transcriptional regulator [Salinivirgaceae bacterium]